MSEDKIINGEIQEIKEETLNTNNGVSHDDSKNNINSYLSEIDTLKEKLHNSNSEFENFKNETIKNMSELKSNFVNFINKNNKYFNLDKNELKIEEFFSEDNLKINFFDIFEEKYFSWVVKNSEKENEKLLKLKQEFNDLENINSKFTEELISLKSEQESSNKKFIYIKEKYEENLKLKSTLEKEKIDILQAKASLENINEQLNIQIFNHQKKIDDYSATIKKLEEEIQKKNSNSSDELDELKNSIQELTKLLESET